MEIQKCRTHMTRTNLGKKTQTQSTMMSINCSQNTSSHAHFSESCQSSQRSTSRATSALPVNLSQQLPALPVNVSHNFGALGQPSPAPSALQVNLRRHPRRSQSTSPGILDPPGQPSPAHLGAPGQPSPGTSALPVNLHQQLRRSRSTFASNSGAPSPATSALLVNPRQQLSARG